jgi:hypothetical protein
MNYLLKGKGVSKQTVKACIGVASTIALSFVFMPASALAASSNIVRNYSTGLCVVVNSTTNGASVVPATCNTSNSTLWQEEIVDKGGYGSSGYAYIRFKNVQNGLCLDLQSNMSTNGLPVVQHTCSSSTTQQWYNGPSNNTLGFYKLQNRATGKCLDAGGTTTIQQYSCGSGDNQQWFY